MNVVYPEDQKRERRMIATDNIKVARDKVLSFFDKHPIFRNTHLEHTSKTHSNGKGGYTVIIRFNEDRLGKDNQGNTLFGNTIISIRYKTVKMPIPESQKFEYIPTLTASVPSVHSSLGQSSGFFLLHLAMVISILGGVTVITLDNDTNNPERAAKGIYSLFEPNMREETKYFKTHATQKNLNIKSERVRFIGPDDLHAIETKLVNKIKMEVNKNLNHSIWRGDAPDTIKQFFKQISKNKESFLYRGGKSKTHKRRKSSTTRR